MKRPSRFKPFFLWSAREIEQEIAREFERDQAPLPPPEWPRLAFAAGWLRDCLLVCGVSGLAAIVINWAWLVGTGACR